MGKRFNRHLIYKYQITTWKSLVLKEIQLKLQWNITTHLLEQLKGKRLTIPSLGKDVAQEVGTLLHCSGESLWKTFISFIKKSNKLHPNDPVTPILNTLLRIKAYVHTKSCTWMFIKALAIVTKTTEMLTSRVGNKLCCVHTMECYSQEREGAIDWLKQQNNYVNEWSQARKSTVLVPTISLNVHKIIKNEDNLYWQKRDKEEVWKRGLQIN